MIQTWTDRVAGKHADHYHSDPKSVFLKWKYSLKLPFRYDDDGISDLAGPPVIESVQHFWKWTHNSFQPALLCYNRSTTDIDEIKSNKI